MVEEAAVVMGALNPDVHVKCCTASTSDPDTWNLSVTVRFGVVTVPVKLGFASGA